MELYLPPIIKDKFPTRFKKGLTPPFKGKKFCYTSEQARQNSLANLRRGTKGVPNRGLYKPVVVIDKDGKPLFCKSLNQAAAMIGTRKQNISKCVRRVNKTTVGYSCFYRSDVDGWKSKVNEKYLKYCTQ